MGEWSGKVVVITGATAGVGRATARRFARGGASIGLLARDEGRLAQTRREVEDLGGHALVVPVDVADADRIELAADLVERSLGPIDVWINNAMTSVFAELVDVTPAEYRSPQTWLSMHPGVRAAVLGAGALAVIASASAFARWLLRRAHP